MPLTLNQMMNLLTCKQETKILNYKPPTQYQISNQSHQYANVNHQLISHIEPMNHKLQKDTNNLSEFVER